ncbi:MAG: type II secretion system protein [Verrucomicrobia bacterium]|nr:type II secretion system protein [Verrucomicrobiota bacterium]
MKSRIANPISKIAFTLIELLVVIAIRMAQSKCIRVDNRGQTCLVPKPDHLHDVSVNSENDGIIALNDFAHHRVAKLGHHASAH